MVLPRAICRLLETFISYQRELVYSFPGLLIFRHISETAYIQLSQEESLGMKDVDIQLALEVPRKHQRGGLKRHFLAHQDCHNPPALQSTPSFSQQMFKHSAEDKREMRRSQEPCHVQHNSNQLAAFTVFPQVADKQIQKNRLTSGDLSQTFTCHF